MSIEKLNIIFDKIQAKVNERNLCLKVCGSYGIFLSSNYLKSNIAGKKLFANQNELIPVFFIDNYIIPRDIDFVSVVKSKSEIESLFAEIGFRKDKRFDTVPGIKRSIFYSDEIKIDVFYDEFDFNHFIDLTMTTSEFSKGLINESIKRIETTGLTIPVTELLLQKLQIVKAGKKDLIDAWWILYGNEISNEINSYDENLISIPLIVYYASNQWGFYKTIYNNLSKLKTLAVEAGNSAKEMEKMNSILKSIESAPKSLSWNARALIGTKLKWYNEVDEI